MLIGLCGPEGAGKSTAARILSEETGIPIVPFAAPLKRMLAAAGVPDCNLYGTPAEKAAPLDMLCGKSARHAMQTLGTEWRDMIGRDLWLRMWLAAAGKAAIADDARFSHEATAIRNRGGIVIRVIRSADDMIRAPRHASEDFRAVPADAEIVNDGDEAALRRRVRELGLTKCRT